MVEPSEVETRIRQGLSDVTHVTIEDLTGTKDHYRAVVVAGAFEGKTRIEQHQLIYAALGELMSGPVHALTLETLTPAAWKART